MNGHWKLRPSLLFLGALILAHGSYSANAAEYDESEKPAVESILEDKKGLEDTSLMEEPKEVKEAKPEEIEEAKPEEIEEAKPAEVEEAEPAEVEEAKPEEKPVPGEITPVPEVVTEPEPVTKKTIPTKEEVKPSGFIHDARLVLKPRSVYLDRKTVDGDDRESFAAGGSLLFISGKWKDTFSVSAEVFTSQKIYGDVDRDGAKLLREGQQGLTVLGNAYGQIDYKDVRVRLGRQEFNLPYVNRNDTRMLPNTFEAVAINLDRKKFDMLVGYINKMKKRDSGAFVSMSEAAGVPGPSDEGTAVLGARYTFSERLVIGALDFYTFDVFNIFYAEANYTLPLSETNRLKLSAQFTDERSVGDELLDASPFQTQV